LKGVEAVGCDLAVETSVFGGCGKEGQMVRVGDGGPHVRIKQISVGGG
jgi:TldD protein